ncbi:uncharacterized protein LOC106153682 [Lingula anatina]|uniref:Uncharacterized protein LOC106153682 n=1 Tax=Lingula anatina TaxID=7574 RepID=A0A1S3HAV1_LINAN|nr:uncharacterized protein LOC106153682 [Lingula anatina]|eukprot:XP_013383167.1 uncharacterized protein LOC106153682 [Lingula anatina]
MSTSLVQGASRGLGLQFCKSLLDKGSIVIATCRNPENASNLQNLRQQNSEKLFIHRLDVTNEEHVAQVASEVQAKFGKLDLLINSAGLLHPSGRGETSLKDVTPKGILDTFSTNTVGPLVMAKHFMPLLQKGSGNIGTQHPDPKNQHKAVLVNMSAKVGSITDNGLGGWYSYRMSKAALNMANKNLSIELGRGKNKVICVVLHPGTVDTDLSRPYHKNVPEGKLFTVEYSVGCLLKIIDSLSYLDTGKYYSWDHKELPF